VAKREPPRPDVTSPQVSLRQAVRPVIVAYGILSNQRSAASALAAEAQTLLDLSENLLRKLGLVHLLTAGSARPDGPAQTDQADRLVEAYAQVGMSWALVVSGVTRLAERLIDDADWPTARLLANLMTESGEAGVAKHIETLVDAAQEARVSAQLARIRFHTAMSAAEVRQAVDILMGLEIGPRRERAIKTFRTFLTASAVNIARQTQDYSAQSLAQDLVNRCKTLNNNPVLEDHPNYGLPEERLFAGLITVLDMCGG
jgi:hypothetical protein